ncbi:MAG: magnesium transporter [Candidatus Omnitrophica bacterium]|nr:magnesium transporter [Candidatus Omnitrophota bacterium]
MNGHEKTFFLSGIVNTNVYLSSQKRVGKLSDFVIIDREKFADVTHLIIERPMGDPQLLVPWEKVCSIEPKSIVIDIESVEDYTVTPAEGAVLLKDYILDKKVFDTEGREVEVVYDVKMVLNKGRLYVTGVDLSKNGLLRRVGLGGLADFISTLALKIGEQAVAWSYVEPLPEEISSFKGDLKLKVLKDQVAEMSPVDIADILEELGPRERMEIFKELDTEHASDTLEELDPRIQRDLVASLKKERAAQLINDMTPGQAADILSVLPWGEVNVLLKLLNNENAVKIRSILEKQEEKIEDFAVSEYLRFSPEMTAEEVRSEFQQQAKGKDVIMYIYVLDDKGYLLGVVDLKELLSVDAKVCLKDMMTSKVISLGVDSTLKDASEMFARYGFRALPVTDKEGKMLGVIPFRDVMNLKHLFMT